MRTLLTAVLIAAIVGCAETRYLTKEQDAEMRAACEPGGSCSMMLHCCEGMTVHLCAD